MARTYLEEIEKCTSDSLNSQKPRSYITFCEEFVRKVASAATVTTNTAVMLRCGRQSSDAFFTKSDVTSRFLRVERVIGTFFHRFQVFPGHRATPSDPKRATEECARGVRIFFH